MTAKPAAIGLLAAVLAASFQFATVQANRGGHWTALYYTGGSLRIPPALAYERIYTFAGSTGYDGQFYHYMAHDPMLRRGFKEYIDEPRLRCRRILVPALAWVLAAGQDRWIDPAFFATSWACFFLGASWLARFAILQGLPAAWGLAFLAVPAALISIDRVTVDLALLALGCGFALYAATGEIWKLCLLLGLAPLARDTGFLLLGGYFLAMLLRRQWKRAGLILAAAAPALGWWLYVQLRTPAYPLDTLRGAAGTDLLVRLLRPAPYHLPPLVAWTAVALDYLSLAGTLAAVVLGAWLFTRRTSGATELAGLAFAALPVALGGIVGWYEPFGYPRVLSPLFLFLGLLALARRSWLPALPLAMVLPRIAMQMAPQTLEIMKWLVP